MFTIIPLPVLACSANGMKGGFGIKYSGNADVNLLLDTDKVASPRIGRDNAC
jgi:hypothetical protein